MSRLAEFRQLERQLASQLAELEAMKNDSSLKRDIEFEKKVRALMDDYGIDLGGVICILDPQARPRSALVAADGRSKLRELKVYVKPDSGERVETRGGNHKTLKAWKAEFGADTVEGWLIK